MSGLIKQRTRKRQFGKKEQVKNMEKDDIKKLVLQAAQGNKAAFGALYEETGRTVYFSCLKLLGDPQLAEDITQETYLTALQKLGTLAQPENFPTWVNRIGINLCKMHFRNNSAPEDNSEEIIEEIPDEGLIPEEYVSNDAKRKIIMDIIDTVLTEEQRRSVILYYFDMLTVPEIAEVMNCTTGTVTSRLSAARKKIKEAVLIYEENNNDRLHAVVPVFILSKLLNKEASNTVLPKLTVFTGSASAANAVPDSVTSIKTISGGKVMFSTVKAKVIAGVCAAAVVGGGITAAVVLSSNGSKDNDNDDGVVVVTESQQSSESSSDADNKADTAGDNSDKYWITGFKGSDPSDTLPQDIFGSKISVPVDLSAIDGGNANMEMYGDDIGRSSDIMSVDKMIGENTNVEITFVSSDESQTKYDLISGNPFDRDASVADILKENSWSVTIPLEEAVDTSDWEYESYGSYSNKEDLDKIIDKMGCPTSIYMNSEYDGMDDYKCYTMYWENVDYTISLTVVETYSNYEEYDVVLDDFSVSDFTYYSKNYPQEEIHEKDGEAVFTSEYTGITTPGESTVNTEENRVKVYDDLKALDLTSDAALPKDISVSYKGIDHVFTGNELIDDVRAEMVDTPDDEYDSALCYGKTSSTMDNIIIFDFWLNSDHTLHKIRMSFTTESDCSIFGITKNSTPEEMAAILGTPEVSDRNGKDQFLDWKSDSMSVNAYYYDGVLQSIQAYFEN
ncbi:sigma-70 family RNA polymerase sigma factor [Ruminococcus sp. AF17-6LB]|uniref:RNA polymerase sigma factor n=2 Tax=Ruminococcus TaxID=1263 RepID=UPI000E46991E|nr:sigma-70 family RNA polymerase sigma factor [Ruminococcus sp. AF17-1AC]RGG71331.1 sigma-70 family RNA polymerase sigma factor [Ruminococcus sp. AF17-6LB]RGG72481.1 sigma-70 family RNA polymerase sigma factor [Ruminococcus sp. AF17-6]RGG72874.1 sigma-70 family RNA polymerase sigma factor [Ruminococcus sp. AF17-24]RGG80164.1 sigma-70 family RNA polymerase sigma factor [Ruminococcus sp. AF17-1AC]